MGTGVMASAPIMPSIYRSITTPKAPVANAPTGGYPHGGIVSPPATHYTAPGTFDSTNNLINTQIDPSASPALTQYRGLLNTSAQNLATLPDRYQTAQNQFDTFAKSTAPQYAADLGDATKLAAANGTLKSGMLSDRYGTIANQRALALDSERSSLLNDAMNGSIDDRYRSLAAFQGLTNDTANQEAQQRGEQRTERGYQYGLSQDATNEANQAQQTQFNQGLALDQSGKTSTNNALQAYQNAQQSYGQDAGSAFGALGQSVNQNGQQASSAQQNALIQRILAAMRGNGSTPGSVPAGSYAPVSY